MYIYPLVGGGFESQGGGGVSGPPLLLNPPQQVLKTFKFELITTIFWPPNYEICQKRLLKKSKLDWVKKSTKQKCSVMFSESQKNNGEL